MDSYALVRPFSLLHYHLKRERPSENFTRGRVYQLILKNKTGCSFSGIREKLNLGLFEAAVCLAPLESSGYVSISNRGGETFFVPYEDVNRRHKREAPAMEAFGREMRQNIPFLIRELVSNGSGVTAEDISEVSGKPKEEIESLMRAMADGGEIVREEKRVPVYYPNAAEA